MEFKDKGSYEVSDKAKDMKVLIVHARWNEKVVNALVNRAAERLVELGVAKTNIDIVSVAGSYELPFGVYAHNKNDGVTPFKDTNTSRYDATIAIGTLIKGDTMHFEFIADAVAKELMSLQFKISRPIIFGLLTCFTEEQALERAGLIEGHRNLGEDWAEAAIEMAAKLK